ncbi:MAG TPA: glycoside hydrolase family 2 TIM barrel-domain containing protein [Prolixibacteraceae bacterium]|nr:glycoside hydrolase family 2 TIM barrel-domain containing protein [Prolixibacteraceae bacterium]
MNILRSFKSIVFCGLTFFMMNTGCATAESVQTISLDNDWTLQPYGEWNENGKLITTGIYSDKKMIRCSVPTTVLGALVKSGMYKDPFFADNLERIPAEWFKTHWRFERSFDLPVENVKAFARLCFDGINYSADVFLNGEKIAFADTLKGAFRRFEIDVTGKLNAKDNKLDVRVFPPQPGDFTIGFVDWVPTPPDRNMGLWRGVSLRFNGEVSVEHPFVRSEIDSLNPGHASLIIENYVQNHTSKPVTTTLCSRIGDVSITRTVELKPQERKLVIWSPQDYPELKFTHAKLWWPFTMGDPNLYTLDLSCRVDDELSDSVSKPFGIRKVESYLNANGSRVYKINGRDIQIRGGGWADDLLLSEDPENLKAQVLYTKRMNLNCIRLEGIWGESETLFNLCDQYGILLMTGWSCQWEWKDYVGKECDDFGGIHTPEEISLVTSYLNDQVLWLRNHPSVFVWVLGSDKMPRPDLEKSYLATLSRIDPTRPTLMACSSRQSEITGKTGVKMNGPYDYVSPNYWYIDTVYGGAFGFNTETGPGPQIPPVESLRKMFPENKLWPVNELWNFHSGRGEFKTIDNYLNALNKRYGESSTIDEFVQKAQLANYEAIKAMFEAFVVNKAKAGGVVQWMLNAPWPKLYWQLYDYYLMPNSAFFGTQAALNPLNLIYNYGDRCIYISNDYSHSFDNLMADIKVFSLNSKEIFNRKMVLNVDRYISQKLLDLPGSVFAEPVCFVDLRISSSEGKELSHNFYWLSSKNDVPDFGKSEWYITPLKEFADFKPLSGMPNAEVQSAYEVMEQGDQTEIKVHLKNNSEQIAFFIELKAKAVDNEPVLPVYWSENYISLLPGEERNLTVTMNTNDLKGKQPFVEVKGVNVK